MNRLPSQYERIFISCLCAALLAITFAGCGPDELVDLEKNIPGIVLDIRYATTNNFTGQKLYPFAKCYLRRAAAKKLRAAQPGIRHAGVRTEDFRRLPSVLGAAHDVGGFPATRLRGRSQERFRHNRGAAVDVTLIRLADGSELPMPTAYDDFTKRAHRDFEDLPEDMVRNRDLLEQVLTKHGFVFADRVVAF